MENKQQEHTYESSNVMPSLGERISYGVADFGYASAYMWVSSFMTIFFTDYVGVPAASVSALLLVVRIFDAINDPIIGSIAIVLSRNTDVIDHGLPLAEQSCVL